MTKTIMALMASIEKENPLIIFSQMNFNLRFVLFSYEIIHEIVQFLTYFNVALVLDLFALMINFGRAIIINQNDFYAL
jgi:hypothetical protein